MQIYLNFYIFFSIRITFVTEDLHVILLQQFAANHSRDNYSFLRCVTNLLSHFLLVLSECTQNSLGRCTQNCVEWLQVSRNRHSKSHTLISTVNDFHLYFPPLSSDLVEIWYKLYKAVRTQSFSALSIVKIGVGKTELFLWVSKKLQLGMNRVIILK